MHLFLICLLACLALVKARDMGKTLKTMPFVTDSLVNLGKMDISFYFNARPPDLVTKSDIASIGSSSLIGPKSESLNSEPCPCSSFKYMKDSTQNRPSELLNKILSGNDFFSFKEPESSTLCCDSHENVNEDILLEFGPKQTQILSNSQNPFSILPFLLDSMHNKPSLSKMPAKTKAVEIYFFPKNRELPIGVNKFLPKTKDIFKKDNIKVVGDKEVKNEFKSNQFAPPVPALLKKDLAVKDLSMQATERAGKSHVVINGGKNIV